MATTTPEDLYLRFITTGDIDSLTRVFDDLAPELLALARRLVRDRHRAEDLVQDTFLTAIEKPESFDRSLTLRPWLVGILVNRARALRRAEGRSVEPDQLKKREVDTPQAVAMLSEHRDALNLAVAELPEKLRTVVEAKLQGKDNDKLARELGISRGALRVRMSRGLRRLRAALPTGFATALAIACLQSTGLSRARARVLQAAGKHPLAFETAVSSTRPAVPRNALIALGATLAMLSVVIVLSLDESQSSDPLIRSANKEFSDLLQGSPVRQPVSPSGSGNRRQTVEPIQTETASTATEEPTPFRGASLAGTVLDQDGIPVPLADVLAWNDYRNRGEPDLRTETNEWGEFRLDKLGPNFVITAKTEILACSQGLRGSLAEDFFADGLEIRLAPSGTMRGVVRAPSGEPIAGAEIWAMNGLNSNSSRDLTAVEGVTVFRAGQGRTQTSAIGEFSIPDLPPNNVLLFAKSKPFLIYREYHVFSEGLIEITLDPGISMSGTIHESTGLPAQGARVRMWPYWGNIHTVESEVRVNENGQFELLSVIPDLSKYQAEAPYAIGVLHDGYAMEVVQPVVPEKHGGNPIALRLTPELVIEGRAVDGAGNPAADITVWIEGEREMDPGAIFSRRATWEYIFGLDEVVTDSDGRFRFEKLHEGEYVLHVVISKEQHLELEREVEAGVQDLRIQLDIQAARKVVIAGRVTDAMTGNPIKTFVATAWGKPVQGKTGTVSHGTKSTFDHVDGVYELAGLEESEMPLTFDAEGYVQGKIEAQYYGLGEYSVDVQLLPSRSLIVAVVNERGEPKNSATLRILRGGDVPFPITHNGTSRSSTNQLINGKFFLHGLPAEPVMVEVRSPPFEVVRVPVDLTVPYEGEMEILVSPVDQLSLHLLVLSSSTEPGLEDIKARWSSSASRENLSEVSLSLIESTELLPNIEVELSAFDSTGNLFSIQTLSPTEARKIEASTQSGRPLDFMFEIASRTFDFSGRWSGYNRPSMLPVLSFSAPRGVIRLAAKVAGYRDVEFTIDLSNVQGSKVSRVIELQSVPR